MITKLSCACCTTPVAEVQNGVLVIVAKHHGATHVTAIPLQVLDKYAAKTEPIAS